MTTTFYSVAANHLAISVSRFVRTNLQRKRYCILVHACVTNSRIQCHPRSTEIVLFLCCSIILCHVQRCLYHDIVKKTDQFHFCFTMTSVVRDKLFCRISYRYKLSFISVCFFQQAIKCNFLITINQLCSLRFSQCTTCLFIRFCNISYCA